MLRRYIWSAIALTNYQLLYPTQSINQNQSSMVATNAMLLARASTRRWTSRKPDEPPNIFYKDGKYMDEVTTSKKI